MRGEHWVPLRRIGFRFGFLVGRLWIFPFPLDLVPHGDGVYEAAQRPLTDPFRARDAVP